MPKTMFDWPMVPKITAKGLPEWKSILTNRIFRHGSSNAILRIDTADQSRVDFEFNKFLRDKKVPQLFKDSLRKYYNLLERKLSMKPMCKDVSGIDEKFQTEVAKTDRPQFDANYRNYLIGKARNSSKDKKCTA
jgi:hypothetical protein